jgi:hypothetical protein
MRQICKIAIVSSVCLVLFPVSALAKDNKKDDSENLKSPLSILYDCAGIESPDARLACFDKSVASLKTAEENKDLVAIDAQSAKKLKKEAFGFNLPSLPKIGLPSFGGDKDGKENLVVGVDSVSKGRGGYIFRMENGQVWQQSTGSFNYIPKGDLTATIKPAAMGSFKISLNNGKTTVRGMRVRRIE